MVTKIVVFGNVKLLKSNPWYSGKFLSVVNQGLAKPKKPYVPAQPPPWYFDRNALSPAQRAVNAEFARIMRSMPRGTPIAERIRRLKQELQGRKFAAARAPAPAPAPAPARPGIPTQQI